MHKQGYVLLEGRGRGEEGRERGGRGGMRRGEGWRG